MVGEKRESSKDGGRGSMEERDEAARSFWAEPRSPVFEDE